MVKVGSVWRHVTAYLSLLPFTSKILCGPEHHRFLKEQPHALDKAWHSISSLGPFPGAGEYQSVALYIFALLDRPTDLWCNVVLAQVLHYWCLIKGIFSTVQDCAFP